MNANPPSRRKVLLLSMNIGMAVTLLTAVLLPRLGPAVPTASAARGARPFQGTGSPTVTGTVPATMTVTVTPTVGTTTVTPGTALPTGTGTPGGTGTGTPAATSTGTVTPTATGTDLGTHTVTPTGTRTVLATGTVTHTGTATPTGTRTIAGTGTAVATSTPGTPQPIGLPIASNGRWYDDDNVATGIQVQNLDAAAPASLHVEFIDSAGKVAMSVDRVAAPGGAPNFYLPTIFRGMPALRDLFSVRVTSDRPHGAIVRTDWFDTHGAAIYTDPEPGADVIVPVFVRRHGGFSSVVSIQNTRATSATVSVTAFGGPDGRTAMAAAAMTIAPNASRHLFAAVDAAFQGLGDFEGWLRVSGPGGGLGVTSYVIADRGRGSPQAVYGFEGVPVTSAASSLNVALFRSDQRGVLPADRLNTRLHVVNPGPLPAMVSLAFYGSDNAAASAACRGGSFAQPAVLIPAGGRHVFEQRPGSGHNVPAGCFGTARINTANASQRVVATVVDATNADALLSAYSALPAAGAAMRVALPLFRRNHVGLSTGIQVMNAGATPATVHIDFSATNAATGASTAIGGCAMCTQTIQPNASYTWWPPAIAAIPDGTFGAAVVTANVPVVVLVNDYPTSSTGPASDPATYLGIAAP